MYTDKQMQKRYIVFQKGKDNSIGRRGKSGKD